MTDNKNRKNTTAKTDDDGPKDWVQANDGNFYPESYARAHFQPEPDPDRPVRQ